jgi:hypothetical protein
LNAPGARPLRALWPYLAHVPVVAWTFSGTLFSGLVLYFRDIAYYYYPNAVFLERSLAQGVWPLWNPTSDAGAPFLAADAVDLALVGLSGASGALRFGPPLHQLVAMAGASRLAAALGLGAWGIWAAGLFYGLSGYFLSTVNLFELHHATAWAPWVIAAFLRLWSEPGPRRVAGLALATALQLATLGAETVLQTALVALVLLPSRPERRRLLAAGSAALVALLLAMPVLLGVRSLVSDTPRARGLPPEASLSFSLRPAVLLDTLVPRAFGDVHTFSDRGYWGQPFFPDGFPYLLSLYWGPALVWLALRAGPGPGTRRLLALGAFGALLALGRHGPLEWLLDPLMRHFRAPVKFLFLTNLALALLAARGVDRARRLALGRSGLALAAGALLVAFAAAIRVRPDLPGQLMGGLVPEILGARAAAVIAASWSTGVAGAGAFLLGAALACRSRTLAPLAAALVGFDLLIANGAVNPATAASFYALRPELAGLLRDARVDSSVRVFAYGAAGIRDLRWAPEVELRNRDVPLYAVDRQSLVPRSHVLDGLEGAFDEDRVGWAPRGSTLAGHERIPSLYRAHHARLRLAAVRYALSFRPLPADLVDARGAVLLSELVEPLRLYELRDPLPRAFTLGRYEVEPDPQRLQARLAAPEFDPRELLLLEAAPPDAAIRAAASFTSGAAVGFVRANPHRVRLRVDGGPGLVFVSEGYHGDWVARGAEGERPLLRADGRYWAVPTRGGGETIEVQYEPAWRAPALCALALGALLALALGVWPLARRDDSLPAA